MKIENISVHFDKQILSCFTLDVPKGVSCLYGASGCGKTTLLNAIAGLIKIDGGNIFDAENKKISYVFQEDRLLPWLNAKENIEIVGGQIDGERWLAQVFLSSSSQKKPRQLSGGMKRRIALARALAYDGDIFLLDEPLKGVDRKIKRALFALILNSVKNKTCILVTHDAEEAIALSTKIYMVTGTPLQIEKEIDLPGDICYKMRHMEELKHALEPV